MLSARPFFIVSAPRSGSTLLRLVLDAHPRLAVPPPAWLYELVYPYQYSYGDLSAAANLHALAEDMLETPTIKGWPLDLTPEAIIAEATEPTFVGLYDVLHRRYAAESDKPRWGEKSPRNCFWMDEIREGFPDAQFIHIIRDGRDMAVDIADTPGMMPQTPYAGIHMWRVLASPKTLDRPAAPAAAVAPADGPPPRLRLGGLGHRVRPHARRQVWPGARAPQPAAPPVPEARPPQEHGLRRGNPHRTGEPQPMPHGPKQAGIAKLRIGQHAGDGEAAGAHLPEQGERLAPLRLQPDTPGKPRPIAGGVGQPRLGHIERGPQQVGAQPGPQRRGDRHLAIGDFPHGLNRTGNVGERMT